MKRAFLFLSLVFVLILIFYGLRIFASGIPLSEMDWNSDGKTDIFEIYRSKDIGIKKVSNCTEYYSLKDGLLVKKRCDLGVEESKD